MRWSARPGPAIYTALGSVYVNGFPVIEGLLNAVHLDHLIELEVNEEDLLKHTGETITLKSWLRITSSPPPAAWSPST